MSSRSNSPNDASEAESEEYVVEAIRNWRHNLRENRLEYFIKWKGYKENDNSWEPKENLTHCPKILEKFETSMSKREKKFYRAKHPERLTGFQRHAEFIRCIGADGPHDSDTEEGSTKQDKQKFYCLVIFDDSDLAEEVTIEEFAKHRPVDAFKFFEQRIVRRRKLKVADSS